MKKLFLGCSSIIAAAILVTSCDNKKTNAEPTQDTEFQSTKDAVYAQSVAAEIAQIAIYAGDGGAGIYLQNSQGGTAGISYTTLPGAHIQLTYNNVVCRDGKKRDGVMDIFYTSSPASYSANSSHEPGYYGTVNLTNFSVDGWAVNDSTPFIVHNVSTGPLAAFNPATDKLKWNVSGHLTVKNIADASKNMSWNGNLAMTVVNTNIVLPVKQNPIIWTSSLTANCAKVEYTGDSKGLTGGSVPYTFSITPENPLVRSYSCSPDKVVSVVTTPSLAPLYSEWHPFISGIATFTTEGSKEPRKIDFSNEGNPDCDNAGKVTIKGVDSPIDFMK